MLYVYAYKQCYAYNEYLEKLAANYLEWYDFCKSFLLHKLKLKTFSGHVLLLEPCQQR